MNMLLSTKLRAIDSSVFFRESALRPCWYANFVRHSDKRKCGWNIGVKYAGEEEEQFVSFSDINVCDTSCWNRVTSISFVAEIIDAYRVGGIKYVKELLKEND